MLIFALAALLQQYGLPEGAPLPPPMVETHPKPVRVEQGGVFVEHQDDGASVFLGRTDQLAAWGVSCKRDAMTDQRKCSIMHYPFGAGDPFIIYLSGADRVGGVCVQDHDFPGRTAMIRIDDRPPISAGEDGCVTLSGLSTALRNGSRWTSRRYSWPYDYPVDTEVSLRGISVALDVMAELRSARK